jgi:hypothetical protein
MKNNRQAPGVVFKIDQLSAVKPDVSKTSDARTTTGLPIL